MVVNSLPSGDFHNCLAGIGFLYEFTNVQSLGLCPDGDFGCLILHQLGLYFAGIFNGSLIFGKSQLEVEEGLVKKAQDEMKIRTAEV